MPRNSPATTTIFVLPTDSNPRLRRAYWQKNGESTALSGQLLCQSPWGSERCWQWRYGHGLSHRRPLHRGHRREAQLSAELRHPGIVTHIAKPWMASTSSPWSGSTARTSVNGWLGGRYQCAIACGSQSDRRCAFGCTPARHHPSRYRPHPISSGIAKLLFPRESEGKPAAVIPFPLIQVN